MKLTKNAVISHCVTFCFGAVFAYALNDYAHRSMDSGTPVQNRLKAIDRSDDNPSARMNQMFQSMSQLMDSQVGKIEKKITGGVEVLEEEDASSYRVIIKGEVQQESLTYEIESGVLQIMGQIERVNKTQYGSSRYISSFSRAFSLPQGIDSQNPKLTNKNDELIIEFNKLQDKL